MARRRNERATGAEAQDGEEGDGSRERPSHADRRRHGERSGVLARKLLSLSEAELEGIALPEHIKEELEEARRIKSGGALRRHERRLAQVLRDADLDEVAAALAEQERQRSEEARRFQRVELWRERLLVDDDAARELAAVVPDIAAGELTSLVDDARRERDVGRPRGASKALFRRLREWLAAAER